MLITSPIWKRRDAIAEIDGAISKVARSVTALPIYIDTAQAVFRPYLKAEEIKLLARLNRTPHLEIGESKLWGHQYLRLAQPRHNALMTLEKLRPSAFINRFDVSVDLCVRNIGALNGVTELVTKHLTQRWPADRNPHEYKGTEYYGKSWCGRNVAFYREDASRKNGLPCLHVEARLTSAPICKTYGVKTPTDLLTVDLIDAIHRNCRFSQVAWKKVEARIWRSVDRDIALRGDVQDEILEQILGSRTLQRIAHNVNAPAIAEARMQHLIVYERRWIIGALHHQSLRGLINPQTCSFPK
jgi:hypothetical protein